MMYTLRFTSSLVPPGVCIRAKLKLNRRTPPMPIEATRSPVIPKPGMLPLEDAVDRAERAALVQAGGASSSVPSPESELNTPAYLQFFRACAPQNPVFPPSEPDALAS